MPLISVALVAAQFILIGFLAWPSVKVQISGASAMIGVMTFFIGIALFTWSYLSMPRASFTIMPEPRATIVLAESGPYQWVRHPMYSSVILCGLGAALFYSQYAKWLSLLVLVLVLMLKLKREESLLLTRLPAYAQYMTKSHALIPKVF
jgi:protein-S-isoprenylcysteine O-methyltransferase Ste14